MVGSSADGGDPCATPVSACVTMRPRTAFERKCRAPAGSTRTFESGGTEDMMKLYVSPASPFGRKASVVTAQQGVADRVIQEPATVAIITRNADVARSNPLAKTPTLLLDDGS